MAVDFEPILEDQELKGYTREYMPKFLTIVQCHFAKEMYHILTAQDL